MDCFAGNCVTDVVNIIFPDPLLSLTVRSLSEISLTVNIRAN